MGTLIIGAVVITIFGTLFYLEDRDGGGLYDPDPSASFRYNNRKTKWLLTRLVSLVML